MDMIFPGLSVSIWWLLIWEGMVSRLWKKTGGQFMWEAVWQALGFTLWHGLYARDGPAFSIILQCPSTIILSSA